MKLVPVTTVGVEEAVAVEVADMGEVVEGEAVMDVEEEDMVAVDMEVDVVVVTGEVVMEVVVMEAVDMVEAEMEDMVVVDMEADAMEDTEEDEVAEDTVVVVMGDTEEAEMVDTEEAVMVDMVVVDINSLQLLRLTLVYSMKLSQHLQTIWPDSTSALHFVFRKTEIVFLPNFLIAFFCLKFVVMKLSLTLSMVCGFS